MTPRQKVLLERLKTLCDRASSDTLLPARAVSVWGYGSYFRSKERPRDVDLDIVIDRSGPGFDLWRLLYDNFDEAAHGYDDPKVGIKRYFSRLYEGEPGVRKSVQETIDLWLEGYTWSIFAKDHNFPPTAEFILERVLTRGLPGVHIFKAMASLDEIKQSSKAKEFVLVWDREHPDVEANVKASLGEDALSKRVAEETNTVRAQLAAYLFEEKVVTKLFKGLVELHERPPTLDFDGWERWLQNAAEDEFGSSEAVTTTLSNIRAGWPASVTAVSASGVPEMPVEKLREELRDALRRVEVEREAVKAIIYYYGERKEPERRWREYVAALAMKNSPKKPFRSN